MPPSFSAVALCRRLSKAELVSGGRRAILAGCANGFIENSADVTLNSQFKIEYSVQGKASPLIPYMRTVVVS